jgi:hypothetical protein
MVAIQQDVAQIGEEPALPSSGRSLRQIVWSRLRHDKVAIACMAVLVFFYAAAIFGPCILDAIGINPYTFDASAISDLGG